MQMPYTMKARCKCGGKLRVTETGNPENNGVRALSSLIKQVIIPNPEKLLHIYRIRICEDCRNGSVTVEVPIADIQAS